MFRSWRLGKLFDIPIFVHPTFLFVPALALLNQPGGPLNALFVVALVLAVFACVLMHEFGHALMARYYGIGTTDITLYMIGGVARLQKMGDSPTQELLIALAGPAVNLAIVVLLAPIVFTCFALNIVPGAPLLAGPQFSVLGMLAQLALCLAAANGVLMVFNLLPIFPMDGGRVFRALLSMGLGKLRATEIAARIALVLALLIGLAAPFVNLMLLLVAAFVIFAGQQELFLVRRQASASMPAPLTEPVTVVAEQDPYESEAPAFRPSYYPHEPGFSGFTWDRHYHVWVKWVNGRPVATQGPIL